MRYICADYKSWVMLPVFRQPDSKDPVRRESGEPADTEGWKVRADVRT
jgi:hypothetical protein